MIFYITQNDNVKPVTTFVLYHRFRFVIPHSGHFRQRNNLRRDWVVTEKRNSFECGTIAGIWVDFVCPVGIFWCAGKPTWSFELNCVVWRFLKETVIQRSSEAIDPFTHFNHFQPSDIWWTFMGTPTVQEPNVMAYSIIYHVQRVSAKHGVKYDFAFLWEHTITCSALALSTVLRTTSLSYGNMPFSGTHPTKTPWPIVLKFCTIDYVGETTKPAKNDWNRLARGGSPYSWNISIYTLPYLTLLYLFFVSLPSLQTRPLNRFARTISQTTRIAPRKCLLGVSSMKKIFHGGISVPQNFQRAFYMQIETVE
jgi:hypothetical protein